MRGKGADLFFEDSGRREVASLRKKKVTFYLYPPVAEKLDAVWLALKERNKEVSKSKIAEIGISKILEELEEKGKESSLGQYFLG